MFSSSSSKNLFVRPKLENVVHDSFEKFEKHGFSLMEHSDYDVLEKELEDPEGNYELLFEDNHSVMWKKINGEGGKNCLSAEHSHDTVRHKYKMVVNHPVQIFYDLLKDYERRHLWDKRDGGREILAIFNVEGKPQNQVVEYIVKKGNLIVSSRDFVTINAEKYDEKTNSYLMIGKSVNEFPKESPSSYIRGNILYLGMKIVPIDDKRCEFYCVTQTNMNGYIPNFVYEWALKSLPSEFQVITDEGCHQRIRDGCEAFTNYYKLAKN
ncbi:hypothetical protein C9374_010279 [Naegleria lovaniensis]|uniref:START domain-containing protein n=1 Tax=Naegleria lovaniensis TaxID=51637 RepID=A0AA88GG85_NAELO|nr:uncharacterized protein C9374_010279 [Naegleria lovaniensis]KAG2374905.1 hypothetical protein C9374_010279 [Naegleria lovaniensis]